MFMKRARLQAISGLFLAALFCGPANGAAPPQPGTINYLEGQASLNGQALTQSAVGAVTIEGGQVLTTQNGRAEILLTPGIFFRIGNNAAVQMDSSGLANTVLTLQRGRALVEVANILPENNVVINENGASTRLLKPGIPPIGILAVIPYFEHRWVDVRAAVLICLGFLLGGWIGGNLAAGVSELILRRTFAAVLFVIAARLFFTR